MKLPNGYGTVYKLKGRRRNPWCARVSIGRDENGVLIRKIIGYAKTKAEALQILADYNFAPYDVESAKRPFSEIFELWKKDKFNADSNRNTVKNYDLAFSHLKQIHPKPMNEIRAIDIQNIIDGFASHDSAKRALNLCSQMYDFCIRHEILKKNIANACRVKQKTEERSIKTIFSEEEIAALWSGSGNVEEQMILMLIYTGLRIGEFLALEKDDVHLNDQWLHVAKAKTPSGIRDVPIPDKVLPFFRAAFDRSKSSRAVTNAKGEAVSYENFKKNYMNKINKKYGFDHTCHECRHTFITRSTVVGIDQRYIKMVVGHSSLMTITEKTYTHVPISVLVAEFNKLP